MEPYEIGRVVGQVIFWSMCCFVLPAGIGALIWWAVAHSRKSSQPQPPPASPPMPYPAPPPPEQGQDPWQQSAPGTDAR